VKAHSYTMTGTKTGSVYVFSELNKLAVCTYVLACILSTKHLEFFFPINRLASCFSGWELQRRNKTHGDQGDGPRPGVDQWYWGCITHRIRCNVWVVAWDIFILTDMGHKVTSPTVPLQGGIFKRRSFWTQGDILQFWIFLIFYGIFYPDVLH
jgi:hypothetical protein